MKKVLAFIFIVLSACNGAMTGAIRESGERIAIQYEQGFDSDILSTTIDGENFAGKSVMKNSSSTFGTVFGAGNDPFGAASIFGSTTTGDFVAVLLGDRGSSLNCELQYADSSGLTNAGGVGVCRHTDGRTIDILW